ncbi:MAG: hypothetical protein KDK78_11260, partial [Chlamydiia bacterium]|nr:hypothetical protein [Chlamydiia bacterium]
MSRRDTIVVAVLINVALLGLLFATAVNGPEEVVKQAEPIRYTAAPPAPTPALIPNLPQAPAKTSVPVPSQVASKPLLLLPRQTDIEAPVRPVEVVAKVEPPAPQPIVQRAAPAPLPKLDP